MEEDTLESVLSYEHQTMDESLEHIFSSMIRQGDVQNAVEFIRSININFLPSKAIIRTVIFDILMKEEDVRCLAFASDYLVTVLKAYPPTRENRQFYYDSIRSSHGFLADLWTVFCHIVNSYLYHREIYIIEPDDNSPDPIKYPNCKFLLEFYVNLFAADFENHHSESSCLMMKLLWPSGDMCLSASSRAEHLLRWINDIYSSHCLNRMGDLLGKKHELLTLMVRCMIQRTSTVSEAAAFSNQSVSGISETVIHFCKNAFTSLENVKIFLSLLSFKYFQAKVSEKIIKQTIRHSFKRTVLTLKDIVDQCMFPKTIKKRKKPDINKEKILRKRSLDKKIVDKKLKSTKLHEYCRGNKFGDLYQELQLSCENVNTKDHNGCTPLHEACRSGSNMCVKFLIEESAKASYVIDLAVANAEGDTPLHIAVKENSTEIVEELLHSGGSELLNKANYEGCYPSDCSTSEEMSKLLQEYQLEGNSTDCESVKERILEAPVLKSFKEYSIYLHALNCLLCSYCNIFNLYDFIWKKNSQVFNHSDKICCHYTEQNVCSEDAGLILEMPDLIETFIESICKNASKLENQINLDIELIPLKAFAASLIAS